MFNLGEISMKKSLVALAALAAATGAFAQSSVTMFGIVDATFAYGKSSADKKTQLTNSGLNSSRFGVRGVEDLGGGMNGSFHLEAGLNNDNGSMGTTNTNNQATGGTGGGGLTFNRRSTVSLGGGFGEVRLGRDYTPHFWNHTVYDPFGTNGVGTTQTLNSSLGGVTTVRASNSIGYLLPGNLGGAFGQIQYYLGENSSTATTAPAAVGASKKDGSGLSLRGGYANGPISAAVAFGRTSNFNTTVAPAGVKNDITTINVGGSYDLGVVKLSALYDQDKVTNGAKGKGFLFGVNAPVGAGEIRAAFSTYKTNQVAAAVAPALALNNPQSRKIAVGYVYNLSKRTAAYGTFARVSNKGGAAQALNGSAGSQNNSSTGFDIGVRHSF
jgi:predicted porin